MMPVACPKRLGKNAFRCSDLPVPSGNFVADGPVTAAIRRMGRGTVIDEFRPIDSIDGIPLMHGTKEGDHSQRPIPS